MSGLSDLARVTLADFETVRNEPVLLVAANGSLALSIDEIRQMGSGAGVRDGGAFSVVFRGPQAPFVEQGMYRLEIGAGDAGNRTELELFLVPVGKDAQGCLYEAVFT